MMSSKGVARSLAEGLPAAVLGIAMLGAIAAADARQVCPPGMGLHCDDAPSAPPSVPSGGGGGAAAGLGAAAAIFSAIGDLLESSESLQSAPSGQSNAAEMLGQAARWNADGVDAYNSGDFDSAIGYFTQAAELAADAGPAGYDLTDAYSRNVQLAQARKILSEAEGLYQSGQYADASREYLLAAQMAQTAKAPDVAAMVRAYHERMMAALGSAPAGARQGVQGTEAKCTMINGTMMCEQSATGPAPVSANAMFNPSASCGSTITSSSMASSGSSNCPPTGGGGPVRSTTGASVSPADQIKQQKAQLAQSQKAVDQAYTNFEKIRAQRRPPDQIGALPKILAGLFPEKDDGLECGGRKGRRHNGQCYAPWNQSADACAGELGGTYYPADAGHPTALCAYDAKPNPMTAFPGPDEGKSCGDAGGHSHGGACWVLGVTRDDCRDLLHGITMDSGGYQYCVYDAGQLTNEQRAAQGATTALKKRKRVADQLKDSLASAGNTDSAEPSNAAPAQPAQGAVKAASAAAKPDEGAAASGPWTPHYTCRAPDGRVFGTDDPMTVSGYDPAHPFCRLDNGPAIIGLTPGTAKN